MMSYGTELKGKWYWLVRETRYGWRITLKHGSFIHPIHGVTFISKAEAVKAIRNGRIVFAESKEKNLLV